MKRLVLWLALALLAAAPAHATVIVTLVPALSRIAVGDSVQLDLVAEFTAGDSVLAWGLDLSLDPALLALSGTPALGPSWLAFATPDGDGLGGVALAGLSGSHLLASLTLVALAPGSAQLGLAVTPRDRTEGFALDPSGFASGVVFQGTTLTLLPEPAAPALLVLAALRHGLLRRHPARPR
jgi:hypothetical protein